jgi:hypothetical protein
MVHRTTISFDDDVWKSIQQSRGYDILNYDKDVSISEKVNELIRRKVGEQGK